MTDLSLDLTPFEGAVRSLRKALAVVSDGAFMNGQSDPVRETLRAGLVQNVEVVFEISWKMVKRRMELDGRPGADIERATYKGLVRLAFEAGLVLDPLPWFRYRDLRNITSHTYAEEKADPVVEEAPRFLADAQSLLDELKKRNTDA